MSFQDVGAGPGARGRSGSTGTGYTNSTVRAGARGTRTGINPQQGGGFGSTGALRTGGVRMGSPDGSMSALHQGALGQQRNTGGRPQGVAGTATGNSNLGGKISDYLMGYSVSTSKSYIACFFGRVVEELIATLLLKVVDVISPSFL